MVFHDRIKPVGGGGTSGGSNDNSLPEPSEIVLSPNISDYYSFLSELSPEQQSWLHNHKYFRKRVETFLEANDYSPESEAFAEEITEAFESDNFLNLFALDIFTQDPYEVWGTLSHAEKDLIKLHPFKAYEIFKNRPIAESYTYAKFGKNGLNDKSDAFRHAFFQAINARDVGIGIAGDFADAHESDVPSVLALEKQMDLANNEHGLFQGGSYFPNYNDQQMSDLIYQDMLNGELDYLSSLNFVLSPLYDANRDGIQDCPTCLNGIISTTVLTPTNQ